MRVQGSKKWQRSYTSPSQDGCSDMSLEFVDGIMIKICQHHAFGFMLCHRESAAVACRLCGKQSITCVALCQSNQASRVWITIDLCSVDCELT